MIVVRPFGFPGGTGFGSAENTTPGAAVSSADAGDEVVVASVAGRSQPKTKTAASVRQIASAGEILVRNDCLLSVGIIALKNGRRRGARKFLRRTYPRTWASSEFQPMKDPLENISRPLGLSRQFEFRDQPGRQAYLDKLIDEISDVRWHLRPYITHWQLHPIYRIKTAK